MGAWAQGGEAHETQPLHGSGAALRLVVSEQEWYCIHEQIVVPFVPECITRGQITYV